MNFRKHTLLSFIFLMINPFLCLCYNLKNIINNKLQVFTFSFSLALIFSYLPIMFDTSSNFFVYFYNTQKDIFDIYTYLPIIFKGDRFNYIFFIFLTIFITIYSWTKICINNFSGNEKKSITVLLCVLFCSFHYRDLMDLNRNICAYALVFIYIFYLKERFKYSRVLLPIFVVLTFYIHLSVMVLWFFYFISKAVKFKTKLSYLILIASAVLGVLLPTLMGLMQSLLSMLPGPIGSRIFFYIYGSEFGVQTFSTGQALQKVLNFVVILSSGFYLIKINKDKLDKFTRERNSFCFMVICLTLIVLMYMTLFERLNLATNFIYGYLILRFYDSKYLLSKLIVFMIVFRSFVINFIVYLPLIAYQNAGVFNDSTDILGFALKTTYDNTIYLLDFDNGYSDDYLIQHLEWGR
ncbi:hypothetical protein HGT70_07980 [Rosenbergiella collisarenosi]|uniref:EpsG family protein n=1 Tax=Rosenbergiella collisarenosi TaxID=1544695 RepID=UPI001BD9D4FF|nr:hypothetical protein [Rosenbergiella collisarenosi]